MSGTASSLPESTRHANAPSAERAGSRSGAASYARSALHGMPNLLTFVALGAIFFLGHRTDWKLASAGSLFGASPKQAEDWCAEHQVPESVCVECNSALMAKRPDFGFCQEHGVADCVHHHPELAQVKGTPRQPQFDALKALRLMARPENNSRNVLHRRLLQLASAETAAKAGIDVDVVREQLMTEAIEANGEATFDPTRVAHLSTRVPGTVAAVFKTVNEEVLPGEILALVDAAQVGQAKSKLLDALVQLKLRRSTLERLKDIGPGAIPGKSLTEAEAAFQQARIACLSARQTLVNLGFEVAADLEEVDAVELAERIRFLGIPPAELAKLPAIMKTANLLPLRTPYAGVVVSSDVVAGEVVDASKLLFTVADPRFMWLMLSVRPEDGRYVSPRLAVEFRTEDNSEPLRGAIAWLSPAIDERTRALRACVTIDNADRRLRDRTFGTARIILRVEPHSIVVPREAVHSTGDAHFVFVRDRDYLKDGAPKVFHVRQVRTGAKDDRDVELLAGALPGEVVATKGSAVLLAQLLRSSLGAGCGCHEH